MHVELSNGQTAELRDISTLTDGDAEDMQALVYDSLPRDEAGQPTAFNPMRFQKATERAVLARVIESWTLPFPVPTDDLTQFRQLSVEDGLTLTKATASHRAALTPDFTQSPKQDSPTKPSDD